MRRPRLLTLLIVGAGLGGAPGALGAPASVPLGDAQVRLDRPARGAALACERTGTPAPPTDRRIRSGRVLPGQRPTLGGRSRAAGASFSLRRGAGGRYAFAGNALPVRTLTARFATVPAPQPFAGTLAGAPRRAAQPSCVDAALPVGVARNGAPILPAFDAAGADQAAREVTDACGGRTDAQGRFAYRRGLGCLDTAPRRRHSGLVGYARDGFAIFGARGARGRAPRDLDACHGHVGRVPFHGRRRRVFHYHATERFPYTVGCFRGRPSGDWTLGAKAAAAAAPAAPPSEPGTTPSRPDGSAEVYAYPGLYPAFDRDREAYVTRCDPDTQVTVSVVAPPGTRVAVDGRLARSGSFVVPVKLAAGQAFAFTVGDGVRVTEHEVRCLPQDFPNWTAERTGESQAAFHLLGLADYAIAFDADGVPAWWYRAATLNLDVKLLPNGNVAWARYFGGGFGFHPDSAFEEHALTGELVRTLRTVGTITDNHDLQTLANGNHLLLSYKPRSGVDLTAYGKEAGATVYDAEIQELTPAGDLVWSWSSKDHIGLEETGRWWPELPGSPYDHVHVNSVEETADGDLVASFRHLDAVYRIDRPTGQVEWKLGGTDTPERLTVLGDRDDAETFGGQHDARELADGTVALYDNRTGLTGSPRGVRFRIDAAAGTATHLETVTDAEVPWSICCGSARRLAGGNWVFSWGGRALITESTGAGEPVFRMRVDTQIGFGFSYRDNVIEPGVISRRAFQDAMDVMHPRPGAGR